MHSHGKVASWAIVLAGLAIVATSCGDDEAAEASTGRYGFAYDALCEATTAAAKDDEAAAERLFFDRAHQPLHELAPEVADVDRAVAARLLEAKEAAEAALGAGEDSSDELARLTTATEEALATVDHPAPRPCEGGE